MLIGYDDRMCSEGMLRGYVRVCCKGVSVT